MPRKINVVASNGVHKIVSKNKYLFSEKKYSKTPLKIKLIWSPLYTSTLIASYCLNCLSLVRLFLCSYSALSWVASVLFFFLPYITIIKKKARKVTVRKRRDKHPGFCGYLSPGLLRHSFLGPPFLQKGPLKFLQKGAHWSLIGQLLE